MQSFEPQTRRLGVSVSELPRLNDLVGGADVGPDDADRVLQRDAWYRSVEKHAHELQGTLYLSRLLKMPAHPASCEICAGWVSHHQVPVLPQYVQDVALDMWTEALARQQVATPRVMTVGKEGITHDSAELTGHQDAHSATVQWPGLDHEGA